MRTIFFISLLLITLGQTNAQEVLTIRSDASTSNSSYSRMKSYFVAYDSDPSALKANTKGSPYLHKEFQPGSILEKGIVLFDKILLKYDIHNDIILIKDAYDTPDEDAQSLVKSRNYQVKIGEDLFVLLPDPNDVDKMHYYQVLSEGRKVHLYKKYDVIFRPEVIATTSLTRDVPASFKRNESYYLEDPNGNMQPLPSKKSKMASIFGEHKQTMAGVINKYQLNISEEKDLVKIIRYYNTL